MKQVPTMFSVQLGKVSYLMVSPVTVPLLSPVPAQSTMLYFLTSNLNKVESMVLQFLVFMLKDLSSVLIRKELIRSNISPHPEMAWSVLRGCMVQV